MMSVHEKGIESNEKCIDHKVSIVECDEIGVIHGCLFADAGFKVIGLSPNPHTSELLRNGRISAFTSIHSSVKKHLKEGSLSLSSDIRKAASASDIIVLTIPTTIDSNKKPDYTTLEKACREVGMGLRKGALVLIAETAGPGVADGLVREALEQTSGLKAGHDFGLAFSPMMANESEALEETLKKPRILGAIDGRSLRVAGHILNMITSSEVIQVSNMKTLEAISLFQSMKDETTQALANELACLCERLRIDFQEVLSVAAEGKVFNLPSPGVINRRAWKDLYLLKREAENVNFNLRLVRLGRRINDEIAECTFRLTKDALKACGKTVRRAKVSVLGVSRRQNTKELPGRLTKSIVRHLRRKVRNLQVYDPYFSTRELAELGFEADTLSKVVEKTDCIIVLTGHTKFARLNLKRMRLLAKKTPAIVDISQIIDPARAEKYGFVYRGLGRGVWQT
jgi:nucleotide sugar dehydrogenase